MSLKYFSILRSMEFVVNIDPKRIVILYYRCHTLVLLFLGRAF